MQIEHKTEKGKILFFLSDSDAFDVRIRFKRFITWRTNVSSHIEMFDEGITVIGLTSEITEEQAKKILTPYDTFFGKAYKCKCEYGKLYTKALDSFKSLMQHLQVYEVNPINPPIERLQYGGGYAMRQSEVDAFDEAQSRTGKWIVLFKPNDR